MSIEKNALDLDDYDYAVFRRKVDARTVIGEDRNADTCSRQPPGAKAMTADELGTILDQSTDVLGVVAKMTANRYDDAVLAALVFVKENRQFVGWLAQVLTPVFGCNADDCVCPEELKEHAEAYEAIRASRLALAA